MSGIRACDPDLHHLGLPTEPPRVAPARGPTR